MLFSNDMIGSDFKDFIANYDHPGSIILLEGKRNVLPEDIDKLIRLGEALALSSKHMRFRSGNASGSDQYFSEGVCLVDSNRLEVITPYASHRKKHNIAGTTYSLDDINILSEPELIYQTKSNKKNASLIEQYVQGKNNRLSAKAGYLIRDTLKVIGSKDIPAATFAIFYDDLSQPKTGGTGHTMKICEKNGVQYITQLTWFNWI